MQRSLEAAALEQGLHLSLSGGNGAAPEKPIVVDTINDSDTSDASVKSKRTRKRKGVGFGSNKARPSTRSSTNVAHDRPTEQFDAASALTLPPLNSSPLKGVPPARPGTGPSRAAALASGATTSSASRRDMCFTSGTTHASTSTDSVPHSMSGNVADASSVLAMSSMMHQGAMSHPFLPAQLGSAPQQQDMSGNYQLEASQQVGLLMLQQQRQQHLLTLLRQQQQQQQQQLAYQNMLAQQQQLLGVPMANTSLSSNSSASLGASTSSSTTSSSGTALSRSNNSPMSLTSSPTLGVPQADLSLLGSPLISAAGIPPSGGHSRSPSPAALGDSLE